MIAGQSDRLEKAEIGNALHEGDNLGFVEAAASFRDLNLLDRHFVIDGSEQIGIFGHGWRSVDSVRPSVTILPGIVSGGYLYYLRANSLLCRLASHPTSGST